jgi:hypothetical protein
VKEEWMKVFTVKEKVENFEFPYDYHSIMHYPMYSSMASDPTSPIMLPVNCGHNCPTFFGSK